MVTLCLVLFAFVSISLGSSGNGIPGNLGIDHVGIVVRNASSASLFLQDAFGCVFDWEVLRDPSPDAGERGWDKTFGVPARSYLKHALMLKCGAYHLAQYIELFEWRGNGVPIEQYDPGDNWMRFSDIGNSYFAFTVENITAVVAHLRNVVFPRYPGTRFVQDPPMSFPLRGELCTSFFIVSPWGQWIEISEWSESTPKHPHLSTRSAGSTSTPAGSAGEKERLVNVLSGGDDEAQLKHPDVGKFLDQIETPAVVIHLDAVDKNIDVLRSRIGRVAWMPPVKAHRSPLFADYLISKGASGIVVMKGIVLVFCLLFPFFFFFLILINLSLLSW